MVEGVVPVDPADVLDNAVALEAQLGDVDGDALPDFEQGPVGGHGGFCACEVGYGSLKKKQ